MGGLDALLNALLPVTRVVDAVTIWLGKRLAWLILAAVIVSALNATIRKVFDTSSNSWLSMRPGIGRIDNHERIVGVLSHLPPQIFVVPKCND